MSNMTLISESDFSQYQSQHLFLLIGSNPLPNYVAAKMLLKPGGHLYLVHTEETHAIAERLKLELGRNNSDTNLIEVDDSDGYDIAKKIREQVLGKIDIGLNYTGGTKAMAVHAYQVISQLDGGRCSYLDARDLRLIFVDLESGARYVSLKMRQELRDLTIEKILALHDVSPQKDVGREKGVLYPEIAECLAKVPFSIWREWCKKNLRRIDRPDKFKNKTELRNVLLPISSPLEELANCWKGAKTIGDFASLTDFAPDEFCEWLDGKWLEHHVLNCLIKLKKNYEPQITDAGMNIEPQKRKFEFDVVVLKGHQVFAISCTTSDEKKLLKSKLFEAKRRGVQMGGDEARVGLVCGAPRGFMDNSVEAIKNEVIEEWDVPDRFGVFGAEDISNLTAHLKDWLQLEETPHA